MATEEEFMCKRGIIHCRYFKKNNRFNIFKCQLELFLFPFLFSSEGSNTERRHKCVNPSSFTWKLSSELNHSLEVIFLEIQHRRTYPGG